MSKYQALIDALAYAKFTGGTGITASVADLDSLLADLERAEKDAERYRWMRATENANRDEWNLFGPYSSPAEIDAAIDAALSQLKGEQGGGEQA